MNAIAPIQKAAGQGPAPRRARHSRAPAAPAPRPISSSHTLILLPAIAHAPASRPRRARRS